MTMKEYLLRYVGKQKRLILLSLVSVFVFLLANLSLPKLVGLSLDAIGSIVDGRFLLAIDFPLLTIYLSVGLVLAVLGVIFDFIFEYTIGVMTQRIVKEIRDDVFAKICAVPIKSIDERKHGDLLQLEIQDVENIANGLFSVFKQLVQGVLSILITIVLMFTVNWILALGIIVLSPLSLFVSKFVASFSHRHFKSQSALMSDLNALSLESISNLETLKALQYEERSHQDFCARDEKLREEGRIAQFSASWTNPTTRFVNNTIYCVIGIAGIVMILYTASYPILGMTMGNLTSFLSYTNEYTKPFNEISSVAAEFETAQFSFRRIVSFLNGQDDVDEGKESLNGPVEDIVFEDVTFSYEEGQHLIEHFSQEIKKGQKVAIVGPTGAGKTTLINLLMRFYDPVSGLIRFDGIDGRSVPKKDLRGNFGMVLQDTWIFSGTIMENVRYARPGSTDEEVVEACKEAHADNFIRTLPHGYETVVSAKSGLSEGERQLLTIARVMLAKPQVVILDEATSNVDTRTEKLITDAFDKVMEGKTSIVIAHRLSTIREADLILVLKDGNVIEKGNHTELMHQHGFYYDLYTSQFR